MLNQKVYSILIKISILAFGFLCISIIVKSWIGDSMVQNKYLIPFFSIDDVYVDSVILTMTTPEKLDLIFQDKSIENYSTVENGSVCESSPEFFKEINNYEYFNAIVDTTLIKQYIKTVLEKNHEVKNWLIPFNHFELQSSSDSLYTEFYKTRLGLYKEAFHQQNVLMGVQMSQQVLNQIDSLKDDSAHFTYKIYEKFRNEQDIIFIDSLKSTNLPNSVQGLVLADPDDSFTLTRDTLNKLLGGSIDIFILDSGQINAWKSEAEKLIASDEIDMEKINTKIRKIIKAKVWSGLKPKEEEEITGKSIELLEQQLVEKSICLVNNSDSLIPVKKIYKKKFTIVWLGTVKKNTFSNYINKYVSANNIQLQLNDTNWTKRLKYYQKRNFIIYVLDTLLTDSVNIEQFEQLKQNMNRQKTLIVNFGNYQQLSNIPDSLATLQVACKSENDYKFAAQSIFGGLAIVGQLPCKLKEQIPFGQYFTTTKTRLKYTIPEDAGLDADKLKEIETIAWQGINSGAFPGCQVFVAKEGKVVFNKSFGYHTYSNKVSVKEDDVYDLASVTKIAATTVLAMKMISEGKMNLNDRLGEFFRNTTIDYTRIKPDTVVNIDTFYNSSIENWKAFLAENDTTNISDTSFITIDTIITKLTPKRNIFKVPLIALLQHKSGIVPAMPVFRYMYYKAYFVKQMKERLAAIHGKTGPMFDYRSFELPYNFPDNTNLPDSLKEVIRNGFKKQHEEYFSKVYIKDTSDIPLTEHLYLKNRYFDTIWRDTKQLPVFSRKVFQYSDVNMILLQMAIDSSSNMTIDKHLKTTIYGQLGLKTITYLPLNYYNDYKIIPTEVDNSWRYGELHGYVHDPSAALIGGMAGNAGLYSNAHDLGILFQMVLNKGSYGGIQYINPNVVKQFTRRFDDTQRGLGFDMPNRKAIVGSNASKKTFGHSGYTGTCVWVDPENQLVYIFLSNRNHPNSKNWRISKYKIRERIHDAIYDAFIKQDAEEYIDEQRLISHRNN